MAEYISVQIKICIALGSEKNNRKGAEPQRIENIRVLSAFVPMSADLSAVGMTGRSAVNINN